MIIYLYSDCCSPFDEKQIRIITTKAGKRIANEFLITDHLYLTHEGQRHGSIGVRVNEKTMFEVTTLRIDKKTNGRHAEVEFVQDWAIGTVLTTFS